MTGNVINRNKTLRKARQNILHVLNISNRWTRYKGSYKNGIQYAFNRVNAGSIGSRHQSPVSAGASASAYTGAARAGSRSFLLRSLDAKRPLSQYLPLNSKPLPARGHAGLILYLNLYENGPTSTTPSTNTRRRPLNKIHRPISQTNRYNIKIDSLCWKRKGQKKSV